MKKTIITSTGNKPGSAFDRRFGRAAWFCLLNEETGETKFIENNSTGAGHGAGSKSAQLMVELGVSKVISGDFGPKAKDLLDKFQIQMVIIGEENLTIEDVLKRMVVGEG